MDNYLTIIIFILGHWEFDLIYTQACSPSSDSKQCQELYVDSISFWMTRSIVFSLKSVRHDCGHEGAGVDGADIGSDFIC